MHFFVEICGMMRYSVSDTAEYGDYITVQDYVLKKIGIKTRKAPIGFLPTNALPIHNTINLLIPYAVSKGISVRLVFCLSFAVMASVRSIFKGIWRLSLRLSSKTLLSSYFYQISNKLQ